MFLSCAGQLSGLVALATRGTHRIGALECAPEEAAVGGVYAEIAVEQRGEVYLGLGLVHCVCGAGCWVLGCVQGPGFAMGYRRVGVVIAIEMSTGCLISVGVAMECEVL
jgi:hypothetical protein